MNARQPGPASFALDTGRFLGVVAVLVTLLLTAPAGAQAQHGFRVAHQVVRTTPTHVEITGTVANETRNEAVDVSVTVEAVGSGGKAAARGITFVATRLPAGASSSFSAKVPAVPGVTGYRAAVSSFRFVQSVEGP